MYAVRDLAAFSDAVAWAPMWNMEKNWLSPSGKFFLPGKQGTFVFSHGLTEGQKSQREIILKPYEPGPLF